MWSFYCDTFWCGFFLVFKFNLNSYQKIGINLFQNVNTDVNHFQLLSTKMLWCLDAMVQSVHSFFTYAHQFCKLLQQTDHVLLMHICAKCSLSIKVTFVHIELKCMTKRNIQLTIYCGFTICNTTICTFKIRQ